MALSILTSGAAELLVYESTTKNSNDTTVSHELLCVDGILLPAWLPLINVSNGSLTFRGIVYIVTLAYLFVGVAILAEKFMASIEMITSKKKEVKVRENNGSVETVVVRVWNETVANLTLMTVTIFFSQLHFYLLLSVTILMHIFSLGVPLQKFFYPVSRLLVKISKLANWAPVRRWAVQRSTSL